MNSLPAAVLTLLIIGCSPAVQPPVCGESFCLPEGGKLIGRENRTEDFNLYRVEANGNRFSIYEGNHPQRRDGSIVLTIGKEWPAFLEVSGPCRSNDDCASRSFVEKIVLRNVR
jgi:hypothetical protein